MFKSDLVWMGVYSLKESVPEKNTTCFLNPGKGAASPEWQKVGNTEI